MNTPDPIMQSKLLAKVVIQSGPQVEIVAIFEQSTHFKFYWFFTAKRHTAPQSQWKFKRVAPVLFGRVGSLDDCTQAVQRENFAGKICFIDRKLYCTIEYLAEFTDGVAFPKYEPRPKPEGYDDHRPLKKSKGFWFSNRDRSFDSIPVRPDEVLVFADYCETCNKKHDIAHFSDGHTVCGGFLEMKNNPALEYTGFRNNMFRFVYRVSVALPVE